MQMVLKCADIGHLTAAPRTHKRWALLLEEEFFRQVYTHQLLPAHLCCMLCSLCMLCQLPVAMTCQFCTCNLQGMHQSCMPVTCTILVTVPAFSLCMYHCKVPANCCTTWQHFPIVMRRFWANQQCQVVGGGRAGSITILCVSGIAHHRSHCYMCDCVTA